MPDVTVTKFDAARAQIDAAIEMYFVSDNPVAFHTLTAAAYNILRDIAALDGSEHPFIKSEFIDEYPEQKRKAIRSYLNSPENFFKHADRDPNACLTFNPEVTEVLLMDACAYFRDKDIERPRYYDAYKAWNGVPKEGLSDEMKLLCDAVGEALKSQGKKKFWKLVKPHLTNGST